MSLTEARWKPFDVSQLRKRVDGDECKSDWDCGVYSAMLTRRVDGGPLPNVAGEPVAIIQICSVDGSARHDWRDFQHIKNCLLGKDWHGVEVYPQDSQLKDPSNAFYLWCWRDEAKRIGWTDGRVVNPRAMFLQRGGAA